MTHYAIYRHREHDLEGIPYRAPVEYYVETYDTGRVKRVNGFDEVEIWCRRNCAFPSPEGPWSFDQAPTGGLMPASSFFRLYERVEQH